MLLSLEAAPIFEMGELGVVSASAVVVSMRAGAPSPPTVEWISARPQGPLWNPNAAGAPLGPIAPEDFDPYGVDEGFLLEPENQENPVPLLPPDWYEGLSPEDLDGIPTIPWTPDHTVEGSLDASRAQIAYKVPVGPGTGSLRLLLRPAREGSGFSPVIDRLYLVGPEGQVLARIATAPDNGDAGDGQHLLVMLPDAPEGSELVIHLAVNGSPTPAQPGGGTGANGGGGGEVEPIDFFFNVQRNDPEPPTTLEEPTPPSTVPASPIGVAPPSISGYGGGWRPLQTMNPIADGLLRIETSRSGGARSAPASRSDAKIVVVASKAYLGPLPSRGGAPLGPTLATTVEEPTPVIEREGRMVDEAIDRIESELDAGLLASMKSRETVYLDHGSAAGERMAQAPETSDAPMAVVPGPGGMPVLVSRLGRSRPRDEAGELTAHLQSRSVEEALSAEIPNPAPVADQVADELEVANAGLATRAAGLIVGLGLATGPLYPDLVALAKKLSRAKRPVLGRRWPFRGRRPRPAV